MAFVSEIEAVSLQRSLEPIRIINEKQRVVDIVFLTKLSEKDLSECSRIRGKEP
ncbi:hypothetical protein SAMN05192561_1081, partial [Halopenitus malekzadehii]